MQLISLNVLSDNYIWILSYNEQAIIIDPGVSKPVLNLLLKKKLIPIAILLTHYHKDHVDGVSDILTKFNIPVYGPKETCMLGTNKIVSEGDNFLLFNKEFIVIHLPGHTLGHIGFYSNPWLFSGDTIFSGGCGKIFEGMSKTMYESFKKINSLPSETIICSGHEYTLRNLIFAQSLLPTDKIIINFKKKIQNCYLKKKKILPTTLDLERKINIFLRCHDFKIHNAINYYPSSGKEWKVFSKLRKKKDCF